MDIKLEDVKTNLIRLQGQLDVWQSMYKAIEDAEKSAKAQEVKNDTASQS